MPKLVEILQDPTKRKAVIADCQTVIDEEVADKGGLSGIAIKTAYKVVKGVKPGFISEAIDNLIDVHIGNLRRKVDPPGAAPLIHTVRGRGFRLQVGGG